MSEPLSFILHSIIFSLAIFTLVLVLYVLRKHLTIVLDRIHRFSTINFCSFLLLMLLKILITPFFICHYLLSSASFLFVSVSSIANSISYILAPGFFGLFEVQNRHYNLLLVPIVNLFEVMFFLCIPHLSPLCFRRFSEVPCAF